MASTTSFNRLGHHRTPTPLQRIAMRATPAVNKQVTNMVVVMVGPTARGITFIAHRIRRYMTWLGFAAQVFECAATRSRRQEEIVATLGTASIDKLCDPDDDAALAMRTRIAIETIDELIDYLQLPLGDGGGGTVGILDGTNETSARRAALLAHCRARDPTLRVVFVESIIEDGFCSARRLYALNLAHALRSEATDYGALTSIDERRRVFAARFENCMRGYEPIDYADAAEEQYSSVKIYNLGRKVTGNRCHGTLPSRLLFFLGNIHIAQRKIWLVRHAETANNAHGVLGGVSSLTADGKRFATNIARFATQRASACALEALSSQGGESDAVDAAPVEGGGESGAGAVSTVGPSTPPRPLRRKLVTRRSTGQGSGVRRLEVWGATSAAVSHTLAGPLLISVVCCVFFWLLISSSHSLAGLTPPLTPLRTGLLNELGGGDLEGMSHDAIERDHPLEANARKLDKLRYRYPGAGGESYIDVIERLRPLIVELERTRNDILIVCHTVRSRGRFVVVRWCSLSLGTLPSARALALPGPGGWGKGEADGAQMLTPTPLALFSAPARRL
jgi:6-phosphofructo-2-kinase